jgi:hypothetical protein
MMRSSTIIDDLFDIAKRPDADIGIAHFYCDYKDPERHRLSEVLGSLTAQLSLQNLPFRSAVWRYLASLQKTHEAARSAKPNDLVDILVRYCSKFNAVYLVLDAIDECPNQRELSYRKFLLDCLVDIQRKGEGRIRVIVTSRLTVDIQKALPSTPVIPILSDSNSADIELYVNGELEKATLENSQWLGDVETTRTMKASIVSRLVNKANGM